MRADEMTRENYRSIPMEDVLALTDEEWESINARDPDLALDIGVDQGFYQCIEARRKEHKCGQAN